MADFKITVRDPDGQEDYTTHRMTASDTVVIVRDELTSADLEPGTVITVEVR